MAHSGAYKRFLGMSTVIAIAGVSAALVLSVAVPVQALQYTDGQLMMKDYDDMQGIVQKIRNTQYDAADPEEVHHVKIRDELFIVLSRRDRDGVRSNLIRDIQSDADDDFYSIVNEVGQQALKYVNDSKVSTPERSTYLLVLENILSEFRSLSGTKLNTLFVAIRDANIDPSDDIISYRQIRLTEGTRSPSKIAREMLKANGPTKEVGL